MALSAQTYQGDGSNTDFVLDFTLGYISESHIHVYVDDVEVPQNTLQFILGGGSVRLPSAPASGSGVLVRRIVPNDKLLHDYENGSLVIESNLDESNLQSIMLQHEAVDGFSTGIYGDINFFTEISDSPEDTAESPRGVEQITITGLASLAEEQRNEFETVFNKQHDQFDATFQAQFTYKHIGNISDYVGDSLPETDKLNSYQYPDDSGEWYGPVQSQTFPIIIPADPSNDNGWVLTSGATQEWVAETVRNPNLLSNHNFLTQTPDSILDRPDSTPRTYPAGYQIFSGVFANESTGITNLTYIDGHVSFSGGDFYMSVPNTGAVERVTDFVASVADFDGKPRTRGVSFALVGDEYRVTVGVDALEDVAANPTPLGSVKFEQGSVATGHEVQSYKGQVYTFNSVAEAVDNCPPIGSRVAVDDYYGGETPSRSGVLFFKVVPSGTGTSDGGAFIDVNANKQLKQNLKAPYDVKAWGASPYLPNNSVQFQANFDMGKASFISDGLFDIEDTISIPSSNEFSLRGSGPSSILNAKMTDVLFLMPSTGGRAVKRIGDFHVKSINNEMTNGTVVKFNGTGSGGVLDYTSGYKFENIEVGGGGLFGCFIDATDTFRLTVRDCGYTGVSNPIRLRGSVVQCTIDNVTGNNDGFTRLYDGQNCGVYMQGRSDYSDSTLRIPENVKVINNGFVFHKTGVVTVGLMVTCQNNDLDFIQNIGYQYNGGDGHRFLGGYIAPINADNVDFFGVLVQKKSAADNVEVDGITLNTYIASTKVIKGVQIGDGGSSPQAEPYGASVKNCKFIGATDGFTYGIHADRTVTLNLDNNKFEPDVVRETTLTEGGTVRRAIFTVLNKQTSITNNSVGLMNIMYDAPYNSSAVNITDNSGNVALSGPVVPASPEVNVARNRPFNV